MAVCSIRAAILDFTAPLTEISAAAGSGVVTLQVFDPERIGIVATNVTSGPTSDLTTRDGVAVWSSGATVRSFTYDSSRGAWGGDTATGSGSTFDLRTTNGIVTWSSGGTSYCRVYDRARAAWKGDSLNTGASQNLRTVDGNVAWSTTAGVHARAYDPVRGAWAVFNSVTGSTSDLQNTNGVVAWSSGNTVRYAVYDAVRGAWSSGSFGNTGSTFDLRNANGLVAWSVGHVVYFRIYDPRRGQWMAGNTDFSSGQTFNLAISNNAVAWTGNSANWTRGYDPGPGAWYAGLGLPLAWFAASTNAGNAPLLVSFIDMSIGGTAWTWNFGDGMGSSSRRSPTYRYTTFGQFNAAMTVSGVGNSSSNVLIVTDVTAPSGSVAINGNAATTTTNSVTLTLAATDNSGVVTAMRFSNDNTNSWSNWVAYATSHPWRLSPGDGVKTVFAQFRDAANNVSHASNDTIMLDTALPPFVSFVAGSVNEGAGTATVLALLDHPFPRAAAITFTTGDGTATAGFDYAFQTGRLEFPPLSTQQSFTVPITQDSQIELNETILLTFSQATNCVAGPQGTLTILDDDLAAVSFLSTNFNVSEGVGDAVVAVRLNAASGRFVTVRYTATNGTAAAGSDFTATSGLFTFAPGQTNLTFNVPITDDTLDELSETIQLRLTDITNGLPGLATNATLTVLDNDRPSISFSRAAFPVIEGDAFVIVNVVLSKPFSQEVRANYTAVSGTATPGLAGDYLPATGLLIFSPDITNQSFIVNLVNDAQRESDETVHLVLDNIVGALAGAYTEADIQILDDDGAPRLTLPRVTGDGRFQTTLRGPAGQAFVIESALELPAWSALVSLTNATGALLWTDPTPVTNSARRFYRTVVP